MADTGYCSIEVHIINNTSANLAVQAAGPVASNATWITGQMPKQGQILSQWKDALWGHDRRRGRRSHGVGVAARTG